MVEAQIQTVGWKGLGEVYASGVENGTMGVKKQQTAFEEGASEEA